jgi:hypothetical protein
MGNSSKDASLFTENQTLTTMKTYSMRGMIPIAIFCTIGTVPTVQFTYEYINNWQIIQKLINQISPRAWPEMKEETKGK